jgi:hypothetical protein
MIGTACLHGVEVCGAQPILSYRACASDAVAFDLARFMDVVPSFSVGRLLEELFECGPANSHPRTGAAGAHPLVRLSPRDSPTGLYGADEVAKGRVIRWRPQFHSVAVPSRFLKPEFECTVAAAGFVDLWQQNEFGAVASHDSSSVARC